MLLHNYGATIYNITFRNIENGRRILLEDQVRIRHVDYQSRLGAIGGRVFMDIGNFFCGSDSLFTLDMVPTTGE